MRKPKKNMCGLLLIICIISAIALCACDSSNEEPKVTPPGNDSKVIAVTIQDQNKQPLPGGFLTVDLSYGSIALSAEVDVTSGNVPAAVFSSQNKDVATVTETGAVTLLKSGEAVLTASAGDKTHSIVLIVSDVSSGKYALVIEGGKAQIDGGENWDSAISVSKQSIVALQPEIPEGMEFVGWSFFSDSYPVNPDYLNRNGDNMFEMPAMNLTVKAEFKVIEL